ncbi:MAG TPA: FecR domain-containing protein [Caulifigura sp.]|nr:FecR domain-containing protein [Caulifigura sp.]
MDSSRLDELLLLPRHLREQPEVVAAIRNLVENDDEALRYYVRWMQFESNLRWVLRDDGFSHSEIVSKLRRQFWQTRLLAAGITTAVALMISVTLGYYSRQHEGPLPSPVTAGVLEAGSDVVWAEGHARPSGQPRNGDRLVADAGQFLLRMRSGAEVVCKAPLDVEINDSWELYLHRGQICVHAPPDAKGFRVHTRVGEVVDLGTVFGMKVEADGESDVQVLEGKVEINAGEAEPLRVDAGTARRITSEGRLAESRPIDPAAYHNQLGALIGLPAISSKLIPLTTPPASLRPKDQTSSATGGVFRERQDVTTAKPVEAYAGTPGKYTREQPPERTVLPAGTVVTSYFIHADNTVEAPVDGVLTFPGEILGMALDADQLNAGDRDFGFANVQYPSQTRRGTLIGEEDDELEISPDRRTLRVHISCSAGAFDQLRVYVSSPRPGS